MRNFFGSYFGSWGLRGAMHLMLCAATGYALFAPLAHTGDVSSSDESFMKNAAEDGLGEIELAQLALKKTKRPDIQMFAKQMLTDHGKANDQLKALASSKKVKLPDSAGVKSGAEKLRMDVLSGRDFDNDYVNTMVDDHKGDVAAFAKESKNGTDADVKQFASTTLPVLKEHLSMIRNIQGKMVTPTQ